MVLEVIIMGNLSPFHSTLKWALESTWPMLTLFIVIIMISRISYIIINKKKVVLYKDVFILLSILYLLMLYFMLLSTEYSTSGVNLHIFREMSRYSIGSKSFFYNVMGNIALFVPFGFILSYFIKANKIRHVIIPSFIVSFSAEIIQYQIGRAFDVDDIILNTTGALIGFMIYISLREIKHKLPEFLQKNWFYNTLSIILLAGVIMLIVSIWLVKL